MGLWVGYEPLAVVASVEDAMADAATRSGAGTIWEGLIAAHQLEANPDDLEFAGGAFTLKGSPDKTVPIQGITFDDCGVQINPLIVEGQVHGGIVQGVAQGLWEEASYDSAGHCRNPSMLDYLVPSPAELPSLNAIGDALSPHGVKILRCRQRRNGFGRPFTQADAGYPRFS